MKVNLIRLELTNYRNIQHAIYEFDGNSKIVGENRIGKTNTLEAICWLLTDKLLNGSSDISSIKPIDDTRAEVRVEGTFQVDDTTIVLRKEYGEEWTKARGSDIETLKGHYLTYYYNGVKQKTQKDYYSLFKKDFNLKGDYAGIDLARLLTDPFYVGNLGESKNWTDLRSFIIDLIGDVSDEDVFKNQPSTMLIKEDLRLCGSRIDQLKKQYDNSIKGLKEQIIGNDAVIKSLEETPCPKDSEYKISLKEKEEVDEQIAKLQSDKASESLIVELQKQIIDKKQQLTNERNKHVVVDRSIELRETLERLNNEYRDLLINKSQLVEAKSKDAITVERLQNQINSCNEFRTRIIARLREIDEELEKPFNPICPTCGRELQGEQYEEAFKNHSKTLNDEKEKLITDGKANKQKLLSLQDQLSKCGIAVDDAIHDIENQVQAKKDEISQVNAKLQIEIERPVEIEETPLINALEFEIEELEDKVKVAMADMNAENALIKDQISDLVEKRKIYEEVISRYDFAQKSYERAVSVKEEKQSNTSKLASYEQKRELINLFIRVKLEMLDEKVKTVFGNIRFQLVSANLKEGSFDPVCKPYIYDIAKGQSTNVSWRSGSKSERVITGIAIAEAIKKQLNLPDLPFLFDEGGEISEDTFNTKFDTNSQLICVKVQDNITMPMVMKI